MGAKNLAQGHAVMTLSYLLARRLSAGRRAVTVPCITQSDAWLTGVTLTIRAADTFVVPARTVEMVPPVLTTPLRVFFRAIGDRISFPVPPCGA